MAHRCAHQLVTEFRLLITDVFAAWRSGRRPWLASIACTLTLAISAAWRQPQSRADLVRVGDVYARQPLKVELARLPASVFFPTFDLPWWAAVVQVAAVLGIAELVLGRPGLTVVGGLAQFASTMAARVMIIYGAAVHLGLPLSQAGVLDTGPSGITTAIGAWLLSRRRAYAALVLLMAGLTVAAAIQGNLDGCEHEAAMVVGILLAATQSRVPRRYRGVLGLLRQPWRSASRVTDDHEATRTTAAATAIATAGSKTLGTM